MAHKTVLPFNNWNVIDIAQKNGVKLISTLPFNIDDYPGYENRRGVGKNGGKKFPI
jgi:25S rRNA (uracil2634-N3)-methyltransferase